MNVFEDLIVELKEENLLEETIIDDELAPREARAKAEPPASTADHLVPESDPLHITEEPPEGVSSDQDDVAAAEPTAEDPSVDEALPVLPAAAEEAERVPKKPRNGKEFYQKRAVGEVSSLQMVEHILTSVEREYLKIIPKPFDDFSVKKALNAFLQVTGGENSTDHQEAEFGLINETEAWCSALSERDRNIPVSSLRHYCENSKPALSSQAMLALARFYRNLPHDENVRAKFDFIITRLFTRPIPGEKRACLFTRDETLAHINTLYKEWSSISLYAADEDQSNVLLTALSFEDLAVEAENASNFDQLISTDFFGRLRMFKESVSELFYAPNVTAAAIEANIRIGNAYVELILRERRKMDAESIHSKYGSVHDEVISEAAGRTFELVEILRQIPKIEPEPQVTHQFDFEPDHGETDAGVLPLTEAQALPTKVKSQLFSNLGEKAAQMNRWFVAFSAILIAGSIGIYIWANYFVQQEASSAGVKNVEMDNLPFREFAKTVRISGDNYYVLLQPSWDVLPKEKRMEILQKVYQTALDSNCTQATLLSKDGKTAGFISANRSEIVMP